MYIDEATCRQRLTLSCLANAFGPGTTTDPQARSMCGDMIAAADCHSSVPDVCRGTAGTLADGDGCFSDRQCQSGYCQYWGLCGVCTARAGAGQPCADDNACPTGMFCSPSSTGGICRAYSKLGQSCDGRYQRCEDGLSCYAGGCVPGRKEGDACQQAVDCFNAIDSLYCGPSHTCERPGVSDPGGPCGYRDGKEIGCAGSAECKGLVNIGDQGICAAPALDGDECEYGCLPPARCVDRKCRVVTGDDCSLKAPAGGGNQYLILRWEIIGEGAATVSCDAAQATTVLADVAGRPFSFPCSLGGAKTPVLPPGFYDVTLSLVDAMSSVLRTAQARVLLTANLPSEIFLPFEP
ncbi:MAG TPA: Dickkopf N-terminal cysteine-rich domain-containing protein [Polyangia bacterium]|nr:Dickkopf N-terminal cysteine-rich domain-containing protein [Polyangia bacterium]